MNKFKLRTDLSKDLGLTKLFRIELLQDTAFGKVGDLGGWVEKESNLSQEGDCWVFGEAQVFGEAKVYGRARIFGNANVLGEAKVFGDAKVYGRTKVYGRAKVYDEARISGDARVYGNARVFGEATVYGEARVFGEAIVCGEARIFGNAEVKHIHQSVSVTNLRWSFTSLPKGIQVGCKFHSLTEWKEKHIEIGVQEGMTSELALEYFRLMKAVRRIQRLEGALMTKQGEAQ